MIVEPKEEESKVPGRSIDSTWLLVTLDKWNENQNRTQRQSSLSICRPNGSHFPSTPDDVHAQVALLQLESSTTTPQTDHKS